MDTRAFRERYAEWLPRARPLLEARRWKEAFAGYPYVRHPPPVWAALDKPLERCRLGLVSTAGMYLRDAQRPFAATHIEGDPTHRELPADAPAGALAIAHDHYDPAHAEADRNAVYPVERLHELVAEGRFAALASPVVSISGYCSRADRVWEDTAPRVVAALRAARADAVLQVPV